MSGLGNSIGPASDASILCHGPETGQEGSTTMRFKGVGKALIMFATVLVPRSIALGKTSPGP